MGDVGSANSQLNNHSIEDEEKSKKIRDLVAEEKRQRAKITSLELQNDSLTEERGELLSEVKRLMGLQQQPARFHEMQEAKTGALFPASATDLELLLNPPFHFHHHHHRRSRSIRTFGSNFLI